MIDAASLSFFTFVAAAATAHNAVPKRLRTALVLPLSNALLLWLAVPDWRALVLLGGFLATCYGAIWLAAWRLKGVFITALLLVLLYFSFWKGYLPRPQLFSGLELPIAVGLSYILIRALQIVIDVYEGALSRPPDLWQFLNFICAWPMLLSGPIQSYQSFSLQIDSDTRIDDAAAYIAFSRIVWGLFSVIVLSDLAEGAHRFVSGLINVRNNVSVSGLLGLAVQTGGFRAIFQNIDVATASKLTTLLVYGNNSISFLWLALSQFLYLVYLYFNFSGYTDIVIGAGRLIGLEMPENFNRPWASRNFLDLWSRWHMSLANWFKTYVFNQAVRMLMTRWPRSQLFPYYAVIGFFVTFFLVGIWHGPGPAYVLCGIGLGAGASLNKLWELKFRTILGKVSYSRLSDSFAYQTICSAMALAFLAVTIVPFWSGTEGIVKYSLILGLPGLIFAFVATVAIIAPISALSIAYERQAIRKDKPGLAPLTVAILLALLMIYAFLYPGTDLSFVYQAF